MPQISQFAESWYAASQIFWVLLTFGFVFFVIGRGMLPKIEATVDARDRKVADDLAAAKSAHAAADTLEESYRQQSDASRAAAQKAVTDAKDKAAKDAEKRLAKIDAELADKLSAAEADIAAARTSAMAEIESVAAEAASDLVAKLSGVKVGAMDAQAAVKAVLHG
ncbi:ATPase [Sphingopyxis sp.]|jgi:F-type H+-transporting ATPase subunit b|uniref:F0F1 ATP synthase subunit B family protein n=1 Tax=Sphingopyxis sp. TaxID=1908224 RepID=UPI0025FB107D|nr:ATPase [Sphingopyxis sp.]MBK6414217.1 ATPase [Sphingopyxis sp.]